MNRPGLRAAVGLIVAALILGARCVAEPPGPLDPCRVLAEKSLLSGRTLEVRGLMIFVTGDAAPPESLAGDCEGRISLFWNDARPFPGLKEIEAAELHPRPSDSSERRVWATFTGVFSAGGPYPSLRVSRIADVKVLPNLAVTSAGLPEFPEDAPAAGGTVRLRATVRNGSVVSIRPLGRSSRALENAAYSELRTWRFADGVDTEFVSTFVFRVAEARACPPSNPRIELQLPERVVLTRWRILPCDGASSEEQSRRETGP